MNDITEHIMVFPELPYYLTVYQVVDKEKDNVSILVRSKVHVNKEIKLPTQYSLDYARDKPNSVAADVLSAVVKRFGLTLQPTKYS